MKLRLYRQPKTLVVLLATVASALALAALFSEGAVQVTFGTISVVYGCAFVLGIFCLIRIRANEGTVSFKKPERILIVAPHQDDCVLCAGGFGARNIRLGGETHVVYLTQPSDEVVKNIRREETIASWRLSGCPASNLHHFNILPHLGVRDAKKIRQAAQELQKIVDKIKPTILFMSLYEGGHAQHDIANYIMSFLIKKPQGIRIYECPEYSPFVSLMYTPHKILALLTRLFVGFVSYCGIAEGVDGRKILNLKMDRQEIELKRRMLREFRSQNGEALARNHGYPDRVIEWEDRPYRSQPFEYKYSFCRFVEILRIILPVWLVNKAFPGDYRSHGLERGITNMDVELYEPKVES